MKIVDIHDFGIRNCGYPRFVDRKLWSPQLSLPELWMVTIFLKCCWDPRFGDRKLYVRADLIRSIKHWSRIGFYGQNLKHSWDILLVFDQYLIIQQTRPGQGTFGENSLLQRTFCVPPFESRAERGIRHVTYQYVSITHFIFNKNVSVIFRIAKRISKRMSKRKIRIG